jgi:hypothetical protein
VRDREPCSACIRLRHIDKRTAHGMPRTFEPAAYIFASVAIWMHDCNVNLAHV